MPPRLPFVSGNMQYFLKPCDLPPRGQTDELKEAALGSRQLKVEAPAEGRDLKSQAQLLVALQVELLCDLPRPHVVDLKRLRRMSNVGGAEEHGDGGQLVVRLRGGVEVIGTEAKSEGGQLVQVFVRVRGQDQGYHQLPRLDHLFGRALLEQTHTVLRLFCASHQGGGVEGLHDAAVIVCHGQVVPLRDEEHVRPPEVPDVVAERRDQHGRVADLGELTRPPQATLSDEIKERVAHVCSMYMRVVRVRGIVATLDLLEKSGQGLSREENEGSQQFEADHLQDVSVSLMVDLDRVEVPLPDLEIHAQTRDGLQVILSSRRRPRTFMDLLALPTREQLD
mmetsp:Transcript_100368/g.321834  ORF Transcript_100368/g.321834 Transcript_100368/m.321834 type:complete len:337 (-) Transcript_100368:1850-2860(-)